LAKKYEGKATFVGVDAFERIPSADDCYSKVSKFVTDFGDKMDYHVAMDGTDGTMAKTWMEAAQQPGIPTAFVIDRDGKVAWIGHPMMGLDETVQKVIDGNFDEKAEADKELTAMAKQQESQAKQAKYLGPVTTALRAKDFRGAVKAADAAIAADASFRAMLIASEPGWMAHYDESGATKLISTLADNDFKDNAMMLNQLAWGMIGDGSTFTHPDTALAVKIAERAVKLSKGDPNILDTLGLAYFKAGRTKDAVSTEQKAILTASQTKDFDAATLTEFKTRLASFEKPIASS
jgi:tetratricopeptide (TPR) repeat protein